MIANVIITFIRGVVVFIVIVVDIDVNTRTEAYQCNGTATPTHPKSFYNYLFSLDIPITTLLQCH